MKPSKQKAEAIEPLVYSLELPKATGIDWGSDLSFRWVYVQSLDPAGAAFKSGKIQKGDYIIGVGNTTLIAQDFNYVLTVNCSSSLEMFVTLLYRLSHNNQQSATTPSFEDRNLS